MASTRAFIAADEIIDYLRYNSSQMFAKSLQMQLVKGALKRLNMSKPTGLKPNFGRMSTPFKMDSKPMVLTSAKPKVVLPVYLESIPEAMALVKDLRENHSIFCSIMVYPVIPKVDPLRLIPTAHTLEDVNKP